VKKDNSNHLNTTALKNIHLHFMTKTLMVMEVVQDVTNVKPTVFLTKGGFTIVQCVIMICVKTAVEITKSMGKNLR
jgi:hypothetical protein